jgi:hypothetical protein
VTGNKDFDCQEMFRHACTFCECADLAQNKLQHDTADIGFYTSPAVINSAFACEVFMKAMLSHHDALTPKTHKLRDLYEALPDKVREWVKFVTSMNCRDLWVDSFGFEILDQVSNAFVEWRYIYEHNWSKGATVHIDIGFLNRFRDALREACCQMLFSTTWQEYLGE